MYRHIFIHESQVLSPLKNQQSHSPDSGNGFPMIAIALLGIMATGFLLVSYYVFVTKCCFRWQQIDLLRRFFITRRGHHDDPLMMSSYSPSLQSRGLDEVMIREIPMFQYTRNCDGDRSLRRCVVCLNEFQELEMMRVLPKCSHGFHSDCIDIWLQNNANCPLCRTSISGRTRTHGVLDSIVAPNSSPRDPLPFLESAVGSDEDFMVIELSGEEDRKSELDRSDSRRSLLQSQSRSHSSRKFLRKAKPREFHRASIMGDECIDVRDKDSQFSIQPIRRSFSMDSAADRHVYLSVQEILRQNNEESSSSRTHRSIFSFGNGRGSRSTILPIEY